MMLFRKLIDRLKHNNAFYAGYPPNIHYDYSEILPLLKYSINNLGDPFELKNGYSTQEYEVEVIKWFLQLLSGNSEGWGYVTTGGTEGIMFGLWNGREKLSKPVLYFSDYAHYCVKKCADIMQLEYRIIKTEFLGQINLKDFEAQLIKDRPALILATVGTTMTSAVDDFREIKKILTAYKIDHYIHADAAIDGMVLPFVAGTDQPYRFQDGADSISISGHKIIGSPIPCGIILTKKRYIRPTEVTLVANYDVTISGSRNGLTVLILWLAIKKNGFNGFQKLIQDAQRRAKEFSQFFETNAIKVWHLEHALTIVVEKLPQAITSKWLVPSNHCFTSFTALPKLTEDMVKEIIADIKDFQAHGRLTKPEKILFPKLNNEIALID